MTGKVWLIPFAASGVGRACAEMALSRGDRVVAGGPCVSDVLDLAERFGDRALPIALDVTQSDSVWAAMAQIEARFARLDVVVANAGYAQLGAVEELRDADLRAEFDANLFGAMALIQAALPMFRAQGSGSILAISCLYGALPVPLAGAYGASLQALEALLETLSYETRRLGVKVSVLQTRLGAFSGEVPFRLSPSLEVYADLRQCVLARAASIKPPGPGAVAAALVQIADADAPPLRVYVGEGGLAAVRTASAKRLATWEAWSLAARPPRENHGPATVRQAPGVRRSGSTGAASAAAGATRRPPRYVLDI